MGMKFLNKKGWHTGSLRNIENVWKAEQKNDAEQKKLEELRKQIIEERERSEFRLLQEQAGLLPKQERLDFLYDSGLAVGKGSSDGFKDLQSLPKKPENDIASSSSSSAANVSAVPGALFEDKPQSANDSWRKLHSDPLLMIRQREQEALARVRNNPVQMAMIHKSIEAKKSKSKGDKKVSKKHREKKSKHKRRHSSPSDSENGRMEVKPKRRWDDRNHLKSDDHFKTRQNSEEDFTERESRRMKNHDSVDLGYQVSPSSDIIGQDTARNDDYHKLGDFERSKYYNRYSIDGHSRPKSDDHIGKARQDYEDEFVDREARRKKNSDDIKLKYKVNTSRANPESDISRSDSHHKPRDFQRSKHDRSPIDDQPNCMTSSKYKANSRNLSHDAVHNDTQHKRRTTNQKISEEERAARLLAMQKDAELHEAQRWTRIKKADEEDAREATQKKVSSGKNFLEAAKTSVYGAGEKGNFTIEESVRRRTHYSQGRSEANAGSAFRR